MGGMGGPGMGGSGMARGGGRGSRRLASSLDADYEEELGKVYDSKVIARLPKYIIPVWRPLALGTAGMLIRTIAQLATPLLVALAVDNYILVGDLAGLNRIAIALLVIALAIWGGSYLNQINLARAGQLILYRMRTEMFDHLQRLSLAFFDQNKVGKLMSRVQNDVNQLQELLTGGVLNLLTNVLTLVGIIVIMITMNPRLALLTLSVVPVLGIIVVIWQQYARRAFIRVRQAIAEVNDKLQQGISGIRVTQSLSREGRNLDEFDAVNKAHLDANITAIRLQALMQPTVQVMTGVAYGLLIIFGGQQVIAGTMGPGVLLGFILYIQRFFEPVMALTMEYTQLQRAMASGARIFELLDVKPDIEDKPGATELPRVKGEINFDHVSFSYLPEIEVLHDINLQIKPGETVAIVGRTGAGKSSLINLLARLYELDDDKGGKVTIDGYNVRDVTQQSLRNQIGIVPQDAFLFAGTIGDNIRYGNVEATHEDVVKAGQAVGADDFVNRMEHGYDSPVGERGGNLSAGQRQLICLARAVITDPPILILDEATSSVDTNAERIMQESLKILSQDRTCIIIAHRLSTVTHANRIVALENGQIVEIGTHQELLDKQGLYYNMFGAMSRPGLESPDN